MSWLTPILKSGFLGLIGGGTSTSESTLQNRIEEIRQTMLDALGDLDNPAHATLIRRLRHAEDAQGLWYLRGDMMAALSSMRGEAAARQSMASITAMFRGLLPGGLSSRPSPLVD